MKTSSLLFALAIAVSGTSRLVAQEAFAEHTAGAVSTGQAAVHETPCEEYEPSDIVSPHITDSHCLEVPGFPRFWEPHEVPLPRWAPVTIGGLVFDFSPTRHVVMLLLASALACIILISAARSHAKSTSMIGRPKGGFATGISINASQINKYEGASFNNVVNGIGIGLAGAAVAVSPD